MGLKINGIPVAGLGLPGRSAYQIAQDGGYQGSEAEFAELLATAATQGYVGQKIGEHNQDESAHEDIRELIEQSAGYSKEETLKEETKALYGLGADAVPDDVMALMSRFQNGLGNEYVWEKYKSTTINTPMYTTYEDTTESWNTSPGSETFYCGDTFDVVNSDGTYYFRISNYSTVTIPRGVTNASQVSALKGKYYMVYPNIVDNTPVSDHVKFMPSNATISVSNKVWSVSLIIQYNNPSIKTETVINEHSYVNSPDSTAYPIDDGFTYKALGQLGNKVRSETGSYTGTGAYGTSNPSSLTFDFEPQLLVISGGDGVSKMVAVNGDAYCLSYAPGGSSGNNSVAVTWSGNAVSWCFTGSGNAAYQLNTSGKTYHYIAIG